MTRMPNELPGADANANANADEFLVGDLHVEVAQQRVTRAGIAITLPILSFELLLALIRAAPSSVAGH